MKWGSSPSWREPIAGRTSRAFGIVAVCLTTLFSVCECRAASAEAESLAKQIRKIGGQVFQEGPKRRIVEINLNGHTNLDLSIFPAIGKQHAITDLSLEKTPTGDDELAQIVALKRLEWLNLYRTRVTDGGLGHLAQLPRLAHLPLGETGVSDDGLKILGGIGSLEYLGLRKTAVTDAGLRELATLSRLKALHLGETAITDAGLVQVAKLVKLEKLWLHDTAVSDQGLKSLVTLGHLRQLLVYNTHVTQAGYDWLQKRLPNCFILYQVTP